MPPGAADSSSSRDQPSIADVRAKLAAAADSSKRLKPKLPGFPKASAAGGAAAAAAAGSGAGGQLFGQASSGSELMYADEEEDDDEDEATPAFQITFDEQGRAVSGRQLRAWLYSCHLTRACWICAVARIVVADSSPTRWLTRRSASLAQATNL